MKPPETLFRKTVWIAMRIIAIALACFMVCMVPVVFVCVEGWWRKSCALSILLWAVGFGVYGFTGKSIFK